MTGVSSAQGTKKASTPTTRAAISQRAAGGSTRPIGKAREREKVSTKNGPSASTPRSKASGAPAPCQDATHTLMPKSTSSGPNRLAGRRRHQYRPISIEAAIRYAPYSPAASGRGRGPLESPSHNVRATIGTSATAASRRQAADDSHPGATASAPRL